MVDLVKGKVSRIGVSLPSQLLEEFDETIGRMGYTDRSKAIHAALRNFITEYKWASEAEGRGVGAIILLYDHTVKGLEDALTDTQHSYEDVVTSTLHIHLDEQNCLEILAIRGEGRDIKELAKELATKRGVKQLKLSIIQA